MHVLQRMIEDARQQYKRLVTVAQWIEAGDYPKAKEALLVFLREFAQDARAHFLASLLYRQMGFSEEAFREIVAASLLEPDNNIRGLYYPLVAQHFAEMGYEQLANAILERGWELCEALYSPPERESKRAEYFQQGLKRV